MRVCVCVCGCMFRWYKICSACDLNILNERWSWNWSSSSSNSNSSNSSECAWWAECVVTKSLYILYCSGCFIPFISFHFIWYFCLNLQSSKIHRCRARVLSLSLSRCTSSVQSVALLLFCSFCSYSSLLSLRSMLCSVSFSPFRLDSFSVVFFIIILYYYMLFYSVSLMLWLCRMRRSNAYLLLIHPIEYNTNTTLTAVCRRILIYLINKFVIFLPRDSLGHPVFLRIACLRFHCFSIWFISVYTVLCIICIPNKQTRLTTSIHSFCFCFCTLTFNLSLPSHANCRVSSACNNVIKSINLLRFIISTCKFANSTKYTNSVE